MELLKYFPKNKASENFCDAEHFCLMLLEGAINIDCLLQLLDKNPDWIEDNIKGRITYSTLFEIFVRSYNSHKYSLFLTYIIEIINGNDIDDMLFDKILYYPDVDIRNTLLISLAHKKLNESQLWCLCKEGISFECYFELAILYYTSNLYAVTSLKNFFNEFLNCQYSYMADELIAELLNCHISSDRIKHVYIKELAQKYKKQSDGSRGEQSGDGSVIDS